MENLVLYIFSAFFLLLVFAALYVLALFLKAKKNASIMIRQLDNYNSIIDQANDAMLVIDIVDGKIHQSNPSASKLLEYSERELDGISLFELHPKEFLNKSSGIVADVWEKGGLIYKDIPFVTKSGRLIPVECSASVAPFAGRPAIIIYARDITERLLMEEKISKQRQIIDARTKDISDSIEYSKRIQESVFVEKEKLNELVPDSFIFFKPREVVSGDFYWFSEFEIKAENPASAIYEPGTRILAVAAVDCTGHGIPGAFVSIIGNALLNRAVNKQIIHTPAHALEHMSTELKTSLNKNKNIASMRDGMDMALCFIDFKNLRLDYAGANNPIFIVRKTNDAVLLIEYKAEKQSITASDDIVVKPFTNKTVELLKGDHLYLFTDGFADQFGGSAENKKPEGKKFLLKRFKELLVNLHSEPMTRQKILLDKVLTDWQGELQQVDDVLVIGIKI